MMDTFHYEHVGEMDPPYVEDTYLEDVTPPKPVWVKWLTAIGLLTIIVAIFASVPGEHLAGCLLAFLNCLIVGITISKLANKRSLCSMLVITFLVWVALGWCLGTIYFAIFIPHTLLLNGSVKLQIVILMFMMVYLTAIFYVLREEEPYMPLPESAGRRLNSVALCFYFFITILFFISRVSKLPGGGIVGTIFSYSYCLPLVIGVQAAYIRYRDKLLLVAAFCLIFVLFTLANQRRYVIKSVLAFLVGFFFLSRIPTKTKLLIFLLAFIAFPAYMIIGNTVRAVVGEAGFEDFGARIHAAKQWKYIAKETKWADSVFGRLFFDGGHAIITETPSQVPYSGFSPFQYLKELGISFTPDKFFDRLEFEANAKYAGNFVLNKYGFNRFYITRKHQVGVTILGHFWLLGGYPFIIIAGIAMALLHWVVFIIINKARRRKPELALFITSCMFSSAIEMFGVNFIYAMHNAFWRLVLGTAFFYLFINPFLKRPEITVPETNSSEAIY